MTAILDGGVRLRITNLDIERLNVERLPRHSFAEAGWMLDVAA
jgi:hypothetical protein